MYCTNCKKDSNRKISFTRNALIAYVPLSAGLCEFVSTESGISTYRVHIDEEQISFGTVSETSGIVGVTFEESVSGLPGGGICVCRYLFSRSAENTAADVRDAVLNSLTSFFTIVFTSDMDALAYID